MKELLEKIKKNAVFSIVAICVAVVAIVVIVIIAGMGKGDKSTTSEEESTTGGVVNAGPSSTYSVNLKTKGGMPLSEVDVYVYADDSLKDLKHFASTDEDGNVSFSLPEYDGYAIALSGVPKGYDVKSSYEFEDKTANIVVTSSLITDGDISSATLGVGDVMYDFTITTPEGEKYTLSEVLSEKKMVLLNFWYTSCSWCVTEFPIMAEAYEMYKDDIEIFALDPLGEGDAAVKAFREQYAYSLW